MGMVGSVLKIREGGLKRLSRFAEVSLQMTSKARTGSPCPLGLQAGLAEGLWLRVEGVGPVQSRFHCSGPGRLLRHPSGHPQPHQPSPPTPSHISPCIIWLQIHQLTPRQQTESRACGQQRSEGRCQYRGRPPCPEGRKVILTASPRGSPRRGAFPVCCRRAPLTTPSWQSGTPRLQFHFRHLQAYN